MSPDNERSRRGILRKGVEITTAGILTSLADCQDAGGPNITSTPEDQNPQGNDGERTDTATETETGQNPSYHQREFVEISFIDRDIIKEIIEDFDQGLETYNEEPGFAVSSVQNQYKKLNPEAADYRNENIKSQIPWSPFNAEHRDLVAVAGDNDGTTTGLFDLSMDELREGLESRNDIEIVYEESGHVQFEGEHLSEWFEFEMDKDFAYVHGFLEDTDMGPVAKVSRKRYYHYNKITETRGQVQAIARAHLELLRGSREPLVTQDTEAGMIADYVFSDGSQPVSEHTGAGLSSEQDEPTAYSVFQYYEDDHVDWVRNAITGENGDYTSEKHRSGTNEIG